MPEIRIRGQTVDVDIISELEAFEWEKPRWTASKLQAASPFRLDRKPSFFVNLDGDYAGTWADSGAVDEYFASGNFVKLIALLRNISYEEAEDYLLEKYGTYEERRMLKLRIPKLKLRKVYHPLPDDIIQPAVSPYLRSRGIPDDVQRRVGVGKGKYVGFTAIPWRRPDGRIMNVMYRSTRGKKFFYEPEACPISKLVWGIDLIYEDNAREVVVCEAPIDAMSWMAAGVHAIAVGGATISKEQADIIRRSPITSIILGGDNDGSGRKLNEQVRRKLGRMYRYKDINFGKYKDANDVLVSEGGRGLTSLDMVFTRLGICGNIIEQMFA